MARMPKPSSYHPTPIAHAICGSLGSALALSILYPLERVRTELQSSSKTSNPKKEDDIQPTPKQSEDSIHVLSKHILSSPSLSTEHGLEEDNSSKSSISSTSWLDCITSDNDSNNNESDKVSLAQTSSIEPSDTEESIFKCWIRLQSRGELYQGVGPVVSTVAVSNFIFFWIHQIIKRWLQRRMRQSVGHDFLASTFAGIINVLLTNPLWVANLRIVKGVTKSTNVFHQVYNIYQKEGISSLWSGTSSSLLLVSNPIIQFVCYEQLKQKLFLVKRRLPSRDQHSISPAEAFLMGALSKALATIVTYPLQLAQVLLRLSTTSDSTNDNVTYGGTFSCLKHVWQEQGLVGLFKGLNAKILQTCLTSALTFLSYEQLLRLVMLFLSKMES
jgi:solute carrier family 25 (peroxisomal adenine nucleotide transporter), member 17